MSELELTFDDDGQAKNLYTCSGQSYPIDEATCDARQARGYFKQCSRCTLRIGGKNDPRPMAKQNESQGKEKENAEA